MGQNRRKAMFTEGNVPKGGVCLSSFVALTNGGRILIGKMARPEIWTERFFVGERFAPIYRNSGKYLLPSRHLAWYESPFGAAMSVIQEQALLRVPESRVRLVDVQSHVRGDVNDEAEPPHWDICFLYRTEVPARIARSIKSPAWFEDFHFTPIASLTADDFTRGHGDVLGEAGMLGSQRDNTVLARTRRHGHELPRVRRPGT